MCTLHQVVYYIETNGNFLLNELDENHLIYALDYPFVKPENAGTFLDMLDLADEVKAKIAHKNAEKLLHL